MSHICCITKYFVGHNMLFNRICCVKDMSFKNIYMSDKPETTYVNQQNLKKKHMS